MGAYNSDSSWLFIGVEDTGTHLALSEVNTTKGITQLFKALGILKIATDL